MWSGGVASRCEVGGAYLDEDCENGIHVPPLRGRVPDRANTKSLTYCNIHCHPNNITHTGEIIYYYENKKSRDKEIQKQRQELLSRDIPIQCRYGHVTVNFQTKQTATHHSLLCHTQDIGGYEGLELDLTAVQEGQDLLHHRADVVLTNQGKRELQGSATN